MRSTNARVRGSLEGPAPEPLHALAFGAGLPHERANSEDIHPEPLHALAFGAGLPAATTTLEEHWYVRDSVPARRGW